MDIYKKKRSATVPNRTADPHKEMYYNNNIELEPLVMILSLEGLLYCANTQTREIKWYHDTKKISYQGFQHRFVTKFVDIKEEDGQYPYVYSSERKRPILNWNNKVELSNLIRDTFQKVPDIDVDDVPEVFHLNKDSGEVVSGRGDNTFKIIRTEYSLGIERLWYVRYSIMDIYLPCVNSSRLDDKDRLMCKVHYARTPETFIQICNQYGLRGLRDTGILTRTIRNSGKRILIPCPKVVAAKGNKEAGISYFKGSVNRIDAFVKRTPNKRECMEVSDIYTKLSKVESVVRLIMDESDDKYLYFAFEEFEMNLAAFIEKKFLQKNKQKQIGVLRDIVKGLIELHKHLTFHGNVSPESILIKQTLAGDIVVRFCGMGASASYSIVEDQKVSHDIEKRDLGKTIWHYLSVGAHPFVKTECVPGFNVLKSPVEEVNLKCPLGADLVNRLVYSNASLSLDRVACHILFWDWDEHMNFLRDFSDQVIAGDFPKIDDVSKDVFKGDWRVKDDEHFAEWFKAMNMVPEEHKKVPDEKQKKVLEESNEESKADDQKGPIYNTTKLRYLLRFIRNSLNHKKKVHPATDKVSLYKYVMENWDQLLIVVYRYFIKHCPTGSPMYNEYYMRNKDIEQ